MNRRRGRGEAFAACAIAGLAVLGSLLASPAANAVEPTPDSTPTPSTTYEAEETEFSLTISPTRLVVAPGEAADEHSILVVNRGQLPVHVEVQTQSFVGAVDGSLAFQDDAPYSAANWVTVSPTSFDLQPGTAQTVEVTVVVPENPDLGDHQVALVFLVPAGESSSNIKINRGVATPIYITVPGAVDDTTLVSDLAAPPFSMGGPIQVTATVENVGTIHRDFRGDTALDVAGTDVTFSDFTVVRDSVREISAEWDPPLLCVCSLSVSITNEAGVSTTENVQVIVFPVIPVLIGLAVLALLILLVLLGRRQYRNGVLRAAATLHASGVPGDA